MGRNLHIDDLRSKDPKTLEVVIQDAVRRPILQLSPQTLSDLVALSEVEELPKPLRRTLGNFAGRVAQEISDLPDGGVISDFLDGMDEIDAAQVPKTLRAHLRSEVEREGRASKERKRVQQLLEKWSEIEPTAIELSTVVPKIEHGVAVESPDDPKKSRAPRQSAPRSTQKAATVEDLEMEKWLSERILEKLTAYREQGLLEAVLIAGIRHEAKEKYPNLMPHEITKVLRGLIAKSQVRKSAGRWSRLGRFW